jgi:hypothetical protein
MPRRSLLLCVFSLAALVSLSRGLAAQAPPSTPTMRPTVASYYKIFPGRTEDWLRIFRKHHLPVLLERQKAGDIVSVTLYRPYLHQADPPWDFKVVIAYRDFPVFGDRAGFEAVERKLFDSDWRRHEAAERARWEITVKHWDELMVEAPTSDEPAPSK